MQQRRINTFQSTFQAAEFDAKLFHLTNFSNGKFCNFCVFLKFGFEERNFCETSTTKRHRVFVLYLFVLRLFQIFPFFITSTHYLQLIPTLFLHAIKLSIALPVSNQVLVAVYRIKSSSARLSRLWRDVIWIKCSFVMLTKVRVGWRYQWWLNQCHVLIQHSAVVLIHAHRADCNRREESVKGFVTFFISIIVYVKS